MECQEFTLFILLKLIMYTLYRHPLVSARPRECESPPPLVSARPIECLDAVSPDPLGGELPAEDGFEWCESRGAPHLPPPWGFRLNTIILAPVDSGTM